MAVNQSMPEFEKKVHSWSRRYPNATYKGLKDVTKVIKKELEKNYSGGVVQRKSGKLARGVKEEVKRNPISARVYVEDRQQYKAGTLEEGGVHRAKKKDHMTFRVGGNWVKPAVTNHRAFRPLDKAYQKYKNEIPDMILKRIMRDVYGR